MLTYEGAHSIDTVGPLEVFATANSLSQERGGPPLYRTVIVAPQAGPVRMGSGISIVADAAFASVRGRVDTLFVAGGDFRGVILDPALVGWVARMRLRSRRVCSVCTGAAILAEAGLLRDKRAATHWAYADLLAERYPEVEFDRDPIYLEQDGIYTSAGVTAGIDLALALLRRDHGHAMAMAAARMLVVFLKRPGGQSQFSAQLELQTAAEQGEFESLLAWIDEHLDQDLSAQQLASRAGTSRRNFFRQFERATGTTPASYVEQRRVCLARRLLEHGDAPVDTIAQSCGFRRHDRMRQAFERQLGVTPSEYRKRFCFAS